MAAGTQATAQREFALSGQEFKFLVRLVGKQTGIVLADHKRDMVYSRLARRLRALGLKNFAEYCSLITSDRGAEEIGNLVNAITTNLTSFFREPHHFEHLRETMLEPLAGTPPGRLRIWSAACSSGMEPYSIAMTLCSALPSFQAWDVRILATDIDTNMLQAAAIGEYDEAEWENIPAPYRKHAARRQGRLLMPETLKSLIAFKPLNLLDPWPMKGQFDAIFCRNVVIYFDRPTQVTLFSRIAERLKPGGWLYIGHSENLMNVSDRFELCGRTTYRRIA